MLDCWSVQREVATQEGQKPSPDCRGCENNWLLLPESTRSQGGSLSDPEGFQILLDAVSLATACQGQSVAAVNKEILATRYHPKHAHSKVCRKEPPTLDLETVSRMFFSTNLAVSMFRRYGVARSYDRQQRGSRVTIWFVGRRLVKKKAAALRLCGWWRRYRLMRMFKTTAITVLSKPLAIKVLEETSSS